MGAYGNDHVETPNLDRLAASGVRFDQAYCIQPVCTPSRSSILTGQYPHNTGCVTNNIPLSPETRCLPELVEFDDYATAYMGKWHLGNEQIAQHGFDEWVSIEDGYWEYYTDGALDPVESDYHDFLVENGFEPTNHSEAHDLDGFSREFAGDIPEAYSKPAFLAREATRFIEEHRDQPFILVVNTLWPHSPFDSQRDDRYDPESVPLPENFDHDGFENQPPKPRILRRGIDEGVLRDPIDDWEGTEADWRELISNYWGCVDLIDTYFGEILDALDDYGLTEDTVTAYTSDHGDMMGSHRLWHKCVMFEEAVRVPLMIRFPEDLDRDVDTAERPVSQIDLVPTLLDAMGHTPPAQVDGSSCWRGEGPTTHPPTRTSTSNGTVQPGSGRRGERAQSTPISRSAVRTSRTRTRSSAPIRSLCERSSHRTAGSSITGRDRRTNCTTSRKTPTGCATSLPKADTTRSSKN